MIPLRDDNPSTSVPFVTYLLIAANVAVFFWQSVTPEAAEYAYLMVPAEITGGVDLAPVKTIHPMALTIFSAMFMHANILHIGGNMLYLWIFGDNTEDMLGHGRFLAFYLACGVAASAAHILAGPTSQVPTLGASGAVAGVLGAYLVTHGSARVLTLVIFGIFIRTVWLPAWVVLGMWILIQVLNQSALTGTGQEGGVAYMAHIGGFIAGVALIFLLGGRKEEPRTHRWQPPY